MIGLIQSTAGEAEPSSSPTVTKVLPVHDTVSPSVPLDHMSGLDSHELLKVLKELKIDFYCSEVTYALLSNDPGFSHLMPYLVSGCYGNRIQPFPLVGISSSWRDRQFETEDTQK